MAITHETSAGMGGIRTAGDLAARMQMSKGMKINEAKEYIAGKLGISVFDLSDSTIMNEIREERGIGELMARPGAPIGIEAKIRIEELLGIKINSVGRFKRMIGM